jgi:hypothetical protein
VGNSGTEAEGVKVGEGVGVGFGVEVDEGCSVIVKLIVSDLAKFPHPSHAKRVILCNPLESPLRVRSDTPLTAGSG